MSGPKRLLAPMLLRIGIVIALLALIVVQHPDAAPWRTSASHPKGETVLAAATQVLGIKPAPAEPRGRPLPVVLPESAAAATDAQGYRLLPWAIGASRPVQSVALGWQARAPPGLSVSSLI